MEKVNLYNFVFANRMAYKKLELAYIYLRGSYTFLRGWKKITIDILSSKVGKNSILKIGKLRYLDASGNEDFKATVTEWILWQPLLLWLIYAYDGIEAKD